MVKYLGLVFIVLCGFGVGYYLSKRLKTRYDFLTAFKDFLSTLEINLRFKNTEIFSLVKLSAPELMKSFFKESREENFQLYWSDCVSGVPKSFALKNDDISLITEFGKLLGTTDIDGQLNHINLYKELIDKNINNSSEELKSKSKLYKLLGLFAGLTIALLLL
jgi:stage III sporulation protein AB